MKRNNGIRITNEADFLKWNNGIMAFLQWNNGTMVLVFQE